jgi:hypothetical protein
MSNLTKALVALAALSFLLAVSRAFFGPLLFPRIQPEGWSQASTNLSLLAIAVHLVFKRSDKPAA